MTSSVTASAGQPSDVIDLLTPDNGPVELARQLCNIPSESGQETRLANAIEQLLARRAPHLTVLRDGDAIIARTELGRDTRVLIAGHLDTVPINGLLPVVDAAHDQTGEAMLRGRGTVDMKSGVAVQLALALNLVAPVFDITWVWYDHEEVEEQRNGLGRLVRNHRDLFNADLAVLGEPSNGCIELGCNGTITVRATYRGRRSHTARAWKGVNSIHRAGRLLQFLHEYEPDRPAVDGLEFREGMQAVRCSGGVAANVVPDLTEVDINFRFAPSRSVQEAEQLLRNICFDADDFEVLDVAAASHPNRYSPAVAALIEKLGLPVRAKLGWTDVARLSSLDIPSINFGPGVPSLAHTDYEEVSVAQIEQAWMLQRAWLLGSPITSMN
ncbi:succinyl-diaminopimelate desuccinylase [uncultured Gulosibacter sp.]|uniref:succinyl-diaminopimelate desuccinylase n=1 Tax=uncultured Gulosibacter sp. TaxID=1339167 RepID=UPI002889A7F6|nr:succinyl-diaminopimelate desuccinylase [uncultured Gulosibacter sp.]